MSVNQNFDSFSSNKPEADFPVWGGREQRHAAYEDGRLKLGGAGISFSSAKYDRTGKHSLRTDLGDVVSEEPLMYPPSHAPRHLADRR